MTVFVNEALLCSLVGLEKEAKLKQRNKLKRTKREDSQLYAYTTISLYL